MLELGRLERVDLRDAWKHEATDFTPWLAEPGNLKLLGDTLGLTLELQSQEVTVGPYRADIVCRADDNTLVVIENQLAKTDHSHLGQIITYSAGLDAVTLVWIASSFTEEHRAAVQWLNDNTNDKISVYALEIELWRIGASSLAPKFNIVGQPNEAVKFAREMTQAAGSMSETDQLKAEFWTTFAPTLQAAGFKAPPPRPTNWCPWGLGRSGFSLTANLNVWDGQVYAAVCIYGVPDVEAFYQLLLAQRPALETACGTTLELRTSAKERKFLVMKKLDLEDRNNWPAAQQWLVEQMQKLDKAFRPVIKALDASKWMPPA